MLIPFTTVVRGDGSVARIRLWNTTSPQGSYDRVRRTYAVTNFDGAWRIVYDRIFEINVTASNYNNDPNFLRNLIISQVGFMPNDSYLYIKVHPGVHLSSPRYNSIGMYCINIDKYTVGNNDVIFENNGIILGGGGSGGDVSSGVSMNGSPGSSGILVELPGRSVQVDNRGTIGGGGGGGGAGEDNPPERNPTASGGSGGAPYGSGGVVEPVYQNRNNGQPGSFWEGGIEVWTRSAKGGAGGNWGQAGNPGSGNAAFGQGGAPGRALVVASGAFSWINRGDIRGEAP